MRITQLGGVQTDIPLSKHYALSLVRRIAQERRAANAFQDAGNHCVYVYCDSSDNVFYIGKGTPDRPRSRHEHPIFIRYVKDELGGRYSVHVLERGMSNDAAEELEQDLLEIFGTGCVNWVDFYAGHTDEDVAADENLSAERQAHAQAVQRLLDDIKGTQTGNRKVAVSHCRHLIELHTAWEDANVARQRADAERNQGYSLKAALSLKWDDFRPTMLPCRILSTRWLVC